MVVKNRRHRATEGVRRGRVFRPLLLAFVIVSSSLPAAAKKKDQPPDPAWAGITARGRMLAEYDVASWHATDTVLALNPAKGSTTGYIAKRTDAGWIVVFGRLNEANDKYLIAFQANQGASPTEFNATENSPLQEDTGFFFLAAKALDVCKHDFRGEKRPYNTAVLPAESGQMYVYIYPAQTTTGIYPLGGDVRYLVSADGMGILEKRQLHKTILEMNFSRNSAPGKIVGGSHSHVLSDVPEDTDVFYVLTRKPSIPEFIGAGKRVYSILVDGTITIVK